MIELVTIFHPDKIADFVSESLAHIVLTADPKGRAAFETIVFGDEKQINAHVFGEASYDVALLPKTLRLDHLTIALTYVAVRQQSIELNAIASLELAADQAIVKGRWGSSMQEYMYAQQIILALETKGYEAKILYSYNRGSLTISALQKYEDYRHLEDIYSAIAPALHKILFLKKLTINGEPVSIIRGPSKAQSVPVTNVWKIPGYLSDTGLTGRKIVCDAGGGSVGGGALAGKDMTKADKMGFLEAMNYSKDIYMRIDSHGGKDVEVEMAYTYGSKEVQYHITYPQAPALDIRDVNLSPHSYGQLADSYTGKMLTMRPRDYVNNWIFSFVDS